MTRRGHGARFRVPAPRREAGQSLVTAVAVIAVFLGFLMFAVHISINLYAESVVTAQAYDAVRHVARAGADDGPARAEAEADLRDALGGYSSRIERLEWGGVDGEVVTLRIVATSPSFLIFTDADVGVGSIDRTVSARVERVR